MQHKTEFSLGTNLVNSNCCEVDLGGHASHSLWCSSTGCSTPSRSQEIFQCFLLFAFFDLRSFPAFDSSVSVPKCVRVEDTIQLFCLGKDETSTMHFLSSLLALPQAPFLQPAMFVESSLGDSILSFLFSTPPPQPPNPKP